jgi:hypothetical protein
MDRVVLGMDPHKRSATIEVMTADETVLGGGRFGTDRDGYGAMLHYARQWPDRVWAVEGCNGIGRHIAHRLFADGEDVVDVPPKLSARARVFATGQGRKTDATDAHSVALVGTQEGPDQEDRDEEGIFRAGRQTTGPSDGPERLVQPARSQTSPRLASPRRCAPGHVSRECR